MKIQISQIIMDAQAQPRTEISSQTIQEYAEVWKDGAGFPPVMVFSDSEHYWLADGWHRTMAAKVAHLTEIEADVKQGTLRDAILYSAGANANHGMRRTNQDKRRAVMVLLNDPEWVTRSDRWIAEKCAVGNSTVGEIRKQLLDSNSSNQPRTGKDGKTRQQPQQKQIAPTYEKWADDNYSSDLEETDDWLSREHKAKQKDAEPSLFHSTFNRTNDNIEWAWWSWNPVTGCEHDCKYCYARDIANRFNPNGFKPTFYPERLEAPKNTNPIMDNQGGRSVFVCSMADLFGQWVPNDWIWNVMKAVKESPQWTFIFLTKNPRRLASVQFPENAWVGCTVDTQARVKPAEEAMKNVLASVKFVSCEPMLEPLKFNNISIFDWVIIGGQSKASQVQEFQPDFDWVMNLTYQAKSAGVKVYWKPNLTIRPREYPGK